MKTLAEKIAVMQAFERGEKIEACEGSDWYAASTPTWNWQVYDYRIAPKKPREFLAKIDPATGMVVAVKRQEAECWTWLIQASPAEYKYDNVRVREVVEDEPKYRINLTGRPLA